MQTRPDPQENWSLAVEAYEQAGVPAPVVTKMLPCGHDSRSLVVIPRPFYCGACASGRPAPSTPESQHGKMRGREVSRDELPPYVKLLAEYAALQRQHAALAQAAAAVVDHWCKIAGHNFGNGMMQHVARLALLLEAEGRISEEPHP